MNPYLTGQLADARIESLHRAADRRPRTGRPGRRTAGHRVARLRSRAGWTLVHLGLRLAATRLADA
jgi:hypothetical protein